MQKLGFTIVELLIVIVVIAILAATSIVAYNGTQQRARDTKRVQDMNSIVKVLEVYKTINGNYPVHNYSNGTSLGGWESSSLESLGEFIAPIKPHGFPSGLPVDPINNAVGASPLEARTNGQYTYAYYRYPAGNSGCDSTRGAFYVLGFIRSDTNGNNAYPGSPGFSCSGRNWQTEFSWVTGGYEN